MFCNSLKSLLVSYFLVSFWREEWLILRVVKKHEIINFILLSIDCMITAEKKLKSPKSPILPFNQFNHRNALNAPKCLPKMPKLSQNKSL